MPYCAGISGGKPTRLSRSLQLKLLKFLQFLTDCDFHTHVNNIRHLYESFQSLGGRISNLTLRLNFMDKKTMKTLASLTTHLPVASHGQSWRVYPKEAALYVTARKLLQNGRHLGPVQRTQHPNSTHCLGTACKCIHSGEYG